ncbi:ABC transporter ATP-binding protein [Streptomyces sp. AV19]|uniref:ABC transporter ATP-binding protein n=1 Tax=Streptomyces sp. AV19 TaxID=2793068 RepID=UPI0018FEF0EA|nr:ABC transporter ATP-binding protein [Streptomyces sp. AV19]MBH1933300.1 ABC transporter ATP-binding protein [Streptomyces sp. AV19]MDG4536191.1 ABC transporter ATP-binding protein/permease [Streptomyces sp. AV19]
MAEPVLLNDQPDERRVLRRAAPHLRPHRRSLVIALTVGLADAAALVAVAPLVGRATDALNGGDRTGLMWAVGVLLALAVVQLGLARTGELLLAKAGENVVRSLRERCVENLASAPLRFLESHHTGELLRRTTSEVAALAAFVRMHLRNIISTAATLVFTLVVLFGYSWQLALVQLVVFVPPTMLVMRWFQRSAPGAYGGKAAAEATVAATFTETLTVREALQTARGLPGWMRRFGRENAVAVRAARRAIRVENRIDLVSLVEGMAMVALLLVGGWSVARGAISIGTVVVFVLASRNLFDSFSEISQLVGHVQKARTGLARLLDLLSATDRAKDGEPEPKGRDGLPRRGELSCEAVGYAYRDGTEVLGGVSLVFSPGDRTGVVGETGSGKTTLSKVLCGLYRPDRGAVRFAGVDLTEIPESELRRRVVLVPQEVRMVTGTVADNLELVRSTPTRADMERAVAELGLQDWIRDLGGLDAEVGLRGGRLSAGERQIIGLLRAVLADPAVLVLDEATADIDPVTAERLERALDGMSADRTLIVIAHRPATIARLPRVVALENGRVVRDMANA